MAQCDSCLPLDAGQSAAAFDAETLALLAKAIAHPARVQLLKYLADFGSCYFGNLAEILPLAPSTISQHVTILRDAGLIKGSSQEQRTCYCVDPARIQLLKDLIGAL